MTAGLFGNILLLASVLGMFGVSICLVAAVKELLKMRLSFATNSHLWFRIMQARSCFKMALGLCQEGLGEHRKAWGRAGGPEAGCKSLGQDGMGQGRDRRVRGMWEGLGQDRRAWGWMGRPGVVERIMRSCPDSAFMASGRHVNILCSDLPILGVLSH